MPEFLVSWHIQLDAKDERDAAEKARKIQLDKQSKATVFDVKRGSRKTEIDLMEKAHAN